MFLGACAVVPPTGPTVMALPAPGRDLQRFQGEDTYCRNYAFNQVGLSPAVPAGQQAAIGSAAVGTALGAVAGGLIGSATGQAGAGAAIGAGTGLVAGSAVGANQAGATTASLQSAYDVAYAQCMTSAGNTIAPPAYGVVGYAPAWPYYAYPYWGPTVSLGFGYGYGYGYGRWRGGYPGYYRRPYGWHR
ncbi:glycine zipper family protein [Falsiroseomonas sp. HW251]|uniref:glycine zipper family protein n=1 Tax=Falsiroseomonas sp. HW251 TaxID=3390998 RepID=UPI003D31B4E9